MSIALRNHGIFHVRAAIHKLALLLRGLHIAERMQIPLVPHAPLLRSRGLIELQPQGRVDTLARGKGRRVAGTQAANEQRRRGTQKYCVGYGGFGEVEANCGECERS